jgi:hypothetical protein
MDIVMTAILNESEDISSNLLRPFLDSVRKKNCWVQVVEKNLDVPKRANEEPCDVNYPFPFSMSFWIIKFSFTVVMLASSNHWSI